jgi:hypothetical protein
VKSFFSTTVTFNPAAAKRAAVATPPAPAPMMIALRGLAFSVISSSFEKEHKQLLCLRETT